MSARVIIPPEKSYYLINHGPCCLIVSGDGNRRNVAAINWTAPVLDDPPIVGCAVEHGIFTHELINAFGEFSVNVMGEPHAAAVLACGKVSGRKIDKFKQTGLTPVPCAKILVPRLEESVAHIECKIFDRKEFEGLTLFFGKVLHAEVRGDCWDGKMLKVEKAKTLHHVGGAVFSVTERRISAG